MLVYSIYSCRKSIYLFCNSLKLLYALYANLNIGSVGSHGVPRILWYFSLRCKKAAGLAAAFGLLDFLLLVFVQDLEVGAPAE